VNPGADLRGIAAQALARIVTGQSRRVVFAATSKQLSDPRDRALLSALLNDGARWWLRFAPAIDALVAHPIRDADIQALLILGLVQLEILQLPDYAAVAATVDATRAMSKPKFAALANALLRRWLRERETHLARLDSDIATRTAHPPWLIDAIAHDYPNDADAILAANNVEAPVWLRANPRRTTRERLVEMFAQSDIACDIVRDLPDALILRESRDVTILPGYAEGAFSVQDGAAQYTAALLDARDDMRVLDACAAPGGKTAHLLERADPHVVALDKDAGRLERVRENLDRLGLRCELRVGDAGAPDKWWDGAAFDRILLDAPCSATGIIRRQSDIKLHRRESDISTLAATQTRILDALWPLLKRGGRLVYATCSILAAENAQQIGAFLKRHADARAVPPDLGWRASGAGMQNLPGESGMDGFFYAIVEKYN
jgi:16S rRNA (cytosine967-C5)-methyltransferase